MFSVGHLSPNMAKFWPPEADQLGNRPVCQMETPVKCLRNSDRYVYKQTRSKLSTTVAEPDTWSSHVKYLSLTIDRKLIFSKPVTNVLNKTVRSCCLLYAILNRHSPVPAKTRINLLQMYVWSILTYSRGDLGTFNLWHVGWKTGSWSDHKAEDEPRPSLLRQNLQNYSLHRARS